MRGHRVRNTGAVLKNWFEKYKGSRSWGLRLPLRWFAIAAANTSRPSGGQAGNQRNFAFGLDARHLRQFFFSRRLRELSSTDGSRGPNLREEIPVVVAV